MRIRISHATTYAYDRPPDGVTQVLRLTPRDHDGQHVIAWRIDLSEDCLLHQHEDAFGNITHSFTAEGPFRGSDGHSRWRSRHAGYQRPGERRGRAVSAAALSARDSAHASRCCNHRIRAKRCAPAPTATRWRLLHALMTGAQSRDHFRHRPDACGDHRGRSLFAPARRLSGPHPYLHRGSAGARHSRRAISAATSIAPTA